MSDNKRELTQLEYVVLGLISMEAQSGYSIVSYFESESVFGWSASPGSIYPMLKRLEKQGIINGELELEYETRPRKMYTLTQQGTELLDAWLREIPSMRPFYEEREKALLRFRFMENRLTRAEILQWLNDYIAALHYADSANQFVNERMKVEGGTLSLHTQLLMESYVMELNNLRTWLEMARNRLQMQPES